MSPARSAPQPPALLVLFDGVCGFCDASVRWLLDHDPQGVLHFAPLQGETAASLRSRHPEIPDDIDTVVVVEGEGARERVRLRAAAVLRILAVLPAPWRWLGILRFLPRSLLEGAYRAFAARRYRVFGQLDACRVPAEDERVRLLP